MSARKPVSTATVRAWAREHLDLIPEAGQKCLGPTARGRLHPEVKAAFVKHNRSKTYAEKVAEVATKTVRVPFTDAKGRKNSKVVTVTVKEARALLGQVDADGKSRRGRFNDADLIAALAARGV